MSDNRVIQDIENYLDDLDENQNYPADFIEFIAEINRRFTIPLEVTKADGEKMLVNESISTLLASDTNTLGFDFDIIGNYRTGLTEPADWESWINTVNLMLDDITEPTETLSSGRENWTFRTVAQRDSIDAIRNSTGEWFTTPTEQNPTYSVDSPKIANAVAKPQLGQDQATGDVYFKSYEFYSGPNMALDGNNKYIDPETGLLKKDAQGNPMSPVFRAGAASEVFEGLSQEAIFEIQQELAGLGLDIGSYNFVPGVIDFTAKGNEIDFIAQLMTQANDANAMFPQLNLIDKTAPTLLGQLRPYLEYKKGVDAKTNAFLQDLQGKFAGEIVPPSESEVKGVVDALFAERGLYATSKDYAKYSTIFGNLQKQAAEREAEIEDNRISLGDVIGLAKSYDSTTNTGPYTYGGFGIVTPTAEEARQQLGKPLLQPIDVMSELGKVMDDLESGRIDASNEIAGRAAAAQQFKSNFMQFEENF